MRRALILFAVAGIAMTSCTSEDEVRPVTSQSNEGIPISFSINTNNMSRATASGKNLETECFHFEVWAYKTQDEWATTINGKDGSNNQAKGETAVMKNYLVGYTNKDKNNPVGYFPTKEQVFTGNWYYEKLGSNDSGYSFTSGTAGQTEATSSNDNQYLKYWDGSYAYYNFYACSPYGAATFNPADHSLTFNEINESSNSNYMFGCTQVSKDNDGYTKVSIKFRRIMAQIRMAFYSELEGYEVELIDYSSSYPGIYCVPADYDDVNNTASAAEHGYVTSATPIVTWTATGNNDANVTYNSLTYGTNNIVCPIDNFKNAQGKAILGESYADRIFGPKRSVLPNNDNNNPNCGFTVNVSLKLTAKDTKEVIYIYNTRVHVPSSATQWKANTLYTYVFKVTKLVTGTTSIGTPGASLNLPILTPIEFEQVTVEDEGSSEQEYPGGANGGYQL